MPGASQAGAGHTKHSLLTTNYEPKSPSRNAGDQSDEKSSLFEVPYSLYIAASPAVGSGITVSDSGYESSLYAYINPTSVSSVTLPAGFQTLASLVSGTPTNLAFQTDDGECECRAVVAGLGFGEIVRYLALPLLRAGKVTSVLDDVAPEPWPVYVYRPQRGPVPSGRGIAGRRCRPRSRAPPR